MIDEEPKRGVNEARFALTLLTCLLVAIGYVVLLRFGGVRNTTFEAGADDPTTQAAPPSSVAKESDLMPHVLPVETPDGRNQRMTQRPTETTPSNQSGNTELR